MIESSTEPPRIASRAEWLRARRVLLLLEADAEDALDDVSTQRRRLPMVKVSESYRFDGPSGEIALLDLFSDMPRLVVHHVAWSDRRGEVGAPCAALIESTEYSARLSAMGCAMAFVSRAPIAELDACRVRKGWRTPLHSSARTTFHHDYQATVDATRGATTYNYRDVSALGGLWTAFTGDLPGASVFRREGEAVFHHYSAYARGVKLAEQMLTFVDRRSRRRRDESVASGRRDPPALPEGWTLIDAPTMIAG